MTSSASRNTTCDPVEARTAAFFPNPIPPGAMSSSSPSSSSPSLPHRLPPRTYATFRVSNAFAHARAMTSVPSPDASSNTLTSIAPPYVCARTEPKHSSSHSAASCAGIATETFGRDGSGGFARFACETRRAMDSATAARSRKSKVGGFAFAFVFFGTRSHAAGTRSIPRSVRTPPSLANASGVTRAIPFAIVLGAPRRFVVPQCASHG